MSLAALSDSYMLLAVSFNRSWRIYCKERWLQPGISIPPPLKSPLAHAVRPQHTCSQSTVLSLIPSFWERHGVSLAGLVRKTADLSPLFQVVLAFLKVPLWNSEVLWKAMPAWLLQLSQQNFPGAHLNVDRGLMALCLRVLSCYLAYRSTARQTSWFRATRLCLCQKGGTTSAFGGLYHQGSEQCC